MYRDEEKKNPFKITTIHFNFNMSMLFIVNVKKTYTSLDGNFTLCFSHIYTIDAWGLFRI